MSSHQYSLSTDFTSSGGDIEIPLFMDEVNEALTFYPISTLVDGDDVTVDFGETDLDAGQQITLNSVVSAHTAIYQDENINMYSSGYKTIKDDQETTTTSTDLIPILTLNRYNLPSGKYLFSWSCECKIDNISSFAKIIVDINGTTIYDSTISYSENGEWKSASGHTEIELSKGDYDIVLSFSSSFVNKTVRIKRSTLSMWRAT